MCKLISKNWYAIATEQTSDAEVNQGSGLVQNMKREEASSHNLI